MEVFHILIDFYINNLCEYPFVAYNINEYLCQFRYLQVQIKNIR